VVTANDYYPGGMTMPGRKYQQGAGGYRYSFNGKEKDDEIKGEGNSIAFEARIYDPRLGKFLSIDPQSKSYPYLSPYSFAANNPIEFIDQNGENPVNPLSWWKKAFYRLTGQHYLVRLNAFAVKNKIDDSQIFFYSYLNKNFAIVIDVNSDTKHVFRENYKHSGTLLLTSEKNDSHNKEVDNYFDDKGNPLPTEDDESVNTFAMGPGNVGKAGKIASGLTILGTTSKSWTAYTFLTNLPKSGRYFGITTAFAKRMAQHGARIIGNADRLIENIPDKLTARGIEQLFINYGRKAGIITEQINSINPKRVEKTKEALQKATDFIKSNYGDKFNYLFN
jgi:RHS repeat-associated protein